MKNMKKIITGIFLLMLVIVLGACSFDLSTTCNHTFSEWETTANCTSAGINFRECTKCHFREKIETDALGHNMVSISAKEPTCSEVGYNDHTECSRCGYSNDKEEYAKLEHNKVIVSAQSASCSQVGWDTYEMCTNCTYSTYVEIQTLPHTTTQHEGLAPTCLDAGYNAYETCSVCGYSNYQEIPALNHNLTSYERKDATCEETGYAAYESCSRCSYSTYVEISSLGHSMQSISAKEPTCTEAGWNAYEVCARCGKTNKIEIPSTGHSFVAGKCNTCGAFQAQSFSSTYGKEYLLTLGDSTKLIQFYERMEESEAAFYSSNANLTETHSVGGTTYYITNRLDFMDLGLTTDEVQLVWREFTADHPLYFWMAKVISIYGTKVQLLTEEAFKNGSDRLAYISSIMTSIDDVLDGIRDVSMTSYEKALYFHDVILSYINYSYKADGVTPNDTSWAHSIVGVFTKQGAVCEGYAKAFQLLLNATSVENIYVTGTADGVGHAWNLVKLDDGNWYWCDLTWDDDATWELGCYYTYFMVNDTQNLNALDGGYTASNGNFLTKHIPYSNLNKDFLYSLPPRATDPYSGQDAVRTTFIEGDFEYAIIGSQSVAVVNLLGTNPNVVIPKVVTHLGKTYSVNMIGGMKDGLFTIQGFSNTTLLVTSISIPKSVTFIWDKALCISSLKTITVDVNNPKFKSVDGVLFTKEMGTLVQYPSSKTASSYTIPDSTKTVCYGAFDKCSNLQELMIGKSVSVFGKVAGPHGHLENMSESKETRIVGGELAMIRNQMRANNSTSIRVSSENTNYVVENGVLYSYDKTVVYTVAYDVSTLSLPASVTKLDIYSCIMLTKVNSISFAGTKDEWNAIEKGQGWNTGSNKMNSVSCSNGTINNK